MKLNTFEMSVMLAFSSAVALAGERPDPNCIVERIVVEGAEPDEEPDDCFFDEDGNLWGSCYDDPEIVMLATRAQMLDLEEGEDYPEMLESQADRNCRLAELAAERASEAAVNGCWA